MYKIVRVRGGKFRSCIVVERNVAVTYIPGQETIAPKKLAEKGYHLLVFKSLKLAKRFSSDSYIEGVEKIWRVRTRGVLKRLPPCFHVSGGGKIDINCKRMWPLGTKMVKVVILTKEVKKDV